ncbi:hypothetical protein [Streptomyces bugieae]|uniref:Secreted protein n=1 Tax=Streptomyces bugieae TaxID=3098223 RepID=A0ABU7NST5_9ACTN|nr:hypothetical protein [Streptomyces sp. DSM 41528]
MIQLRVLIRLGCLSIHLGCLTIDVGCLTIHLDCPSIDVGCLTTHLCATVRGTHGPILPHRVLPTPTP